MNHVVVGNLQQRGLRTMDMEFGLDWFGCSPTSLSTHGNVYFLDRTTYSFISGIKLLPCSWLIQCHCFYMFSMNWLLKFPNQNDSMFCCKNNCINYVQQTASSQGFFIKAVVILEIKRIQNVHTIQVMPKHMSIYYIQIIYFHCPS